MNLSIILNSRGRVNLLKNLISSIVRTSNNLSEIELFVCVDNDDTETTNEIPILEQMYGQWVRFGIVTRCPNLNYNFNLIFPHLRGKYVMIVNDDIEFINNGWDTNAVNTLNQYCKDKNCQIVYGRTNDNSVDKSGNYASFPIISSEAIKTLGYVMSVKYLSHGADVELYRIFDAVKKVCDVDVQIDHTGHNTLQAVNSPDKVQSEIRQNRNLDEIDCFNSDISLDVFKLKAAINKPNNSGKKLAVIYNICGISGKEDVNYYIRVINSIYAQNNIDDYLPVVSACKVKREVLNVIKNKFPELMVVAMNEHVPVNVSFNKTIQKIVDYHGPCEGYFYLDYGINLESNKNLLNNLYSKFKSGPYGMISTRTDNDNGYHLWFGLGKFHGDESENDKLFENGDFVIPVGKCVNLHAQIFSHKLYEAYNRKIIPDIFAAYCTESVFSFLNAALRLKWLVTKDHILHHEQIPLNGASGFGCGFDGLDKMFLDQTPIIERIIPGIPFGMGYDESRKYVLHRKDQYDEEGFCINNDLKKYIADYMFLKEDILNYESLRCSVY